MEILRTNTTQAIHARFSGLVPEQEYTLDYLDLNTGFTEIVTSESDVNGEVAFLLDSRYLNNDGVITASVIDFSDEIVINDGIEILRPYCDIAKLASDLNKTYAQAVELEQISRYIIDSETDGFGFRRVEKEFTANGTDYLVVDEKIHKLYKLYENAELIYDESLENNNQIFEISKDRTSIVLSESPTNKVEYPKVWRDRYLSTEFKEGYEYVVDAEFGWKVIPQDIQKACTLLAADIASDSMKYINKYIESFDNQEFKIRFAKGFTNGTGNMVVDRILKKYNNMFGKIGVL
jgi:hypothetical protein